MVNQLTFITSTFSDRMEKRTNFRWVILSLLFFATTINYIDRQVIGLLKPYIEKDLNWTEADYGYIVSAFQLAYAFGLLLTGRMLDRFGTRLVYAIAMAVWSIGGMIHAVARTLVDFVLARSILGLGEAANFPAAIKTVAKWFPVKDRALVTGIFNSGSSIGAISAPIIVAGITLNFGWRWAFIITGALGFIWIVFWLIFYDSPEKHKKINKKELNYILQGRQEIHTDKISWGKLFKYKQTYAICLTRLVTDWVWWFFLYWIPDFLKKTQGLDLKESVLPLIVIYTMASLGGISGGAISSAFIGANKSIDYSRKTAILICALFVLPLSIAAETQNLWIAITLIGFAAAAHSGFASNIFTVVSDIYPKNAVATMVGISGFIGAIGGAMAASFVGLVLEITHNYFFIFVCASTMYLLAWAILKVFIPKIELLKIR